MSSFHRANQSPPASEEVQISSEATRYAPKLLRNFTGCKGKVTCVAFTPDAKNLVSTSSDGSLTLWNSKPQQRSYQLGRHQAAATCVAVSDDGEWFASGSRDHSVRFWKSTVRGIPRKNQQSTNQGTYKVHSGGIRAIDLSRNGHVMLTGSEDKTIKLWGLDLTKHGIPDKRFLWCGRGHTNWVNGARLSPDCSRIASCSDDKTVRIWDVEARSQMNVFRDHSKSVLSVGFFPGNQSGHVHHCVVSGGEDRTINMWDVRSKQTIQHYEAHKNSVNSVAFHPSGNFLLSTSKDCTVRLWDVREGRLLYTLHAHTASVNSGSFSADGMQFATASDDGMVLSWETRLGTQVPLDHHDGLGPQVANIGAPKNRTSLLKPRHPVSLPKTKALAAQRSTIPRPSKKSVGKQEELAVHSAKPQSQRASTNNSQAGSMPRDTSEIVARSLQLLETRLRINEDAVARLLSTTKTNNL